MPDNHLFLNGNKVSRLGFGCWQLAGDYTIDGRPNGYGAVDLKASVRAIHIALENGINFFDTAVAYGYGKSEEILGEALKTNPYPNTTTPVICTKFGIKLGSKNDEEDFFGENITRSVEGSLKRLKVDCLDVLLLHNPPDNFDFSVYDTGPFEKLVQAGKIRSYGVSCKTQKGVANVFNSGFGSVIEAVYNPLDRRLESYFNNSSPDSNYLFICRVPLASGFISPKTLIADPVFPANDIRHNFNREQVEWVVRAVRKLSFLNDLEGGIAVSALRFQISNPYNTIAIPGQKNASQVADTILAMQLGPLPDEIINKIADSVPDVFYKWKG